MWTVFLFVSQPPSSSDLLSLVVEGTTVGRLTLSERSSLGGAVEEPISDGVRGGGAKDGGTPQRGGDGEGGQSRAEDGDTCERIAGSGNGAGDVDARSTGAGARILGGGVGGAAAKMVEARRDNPGGRGAVQKSWHSRAG
jgi:hypothetical protein